MSQLEGAPRISPFLWFDGQAAEAAEFYISIFPNSRRITELRNPGGGEPGPKGEILTVEFELDGQRFIALNGGPNFKFTEAVSFLVSCAGQDEIDYYWSRLTAGGGSEGVCGWLKDKYGLSWQVAPAGFAKLLKHPAAMRAMMGMKKFDLAALQAAAGQQE